MKKLCVISTLILFTLNISAFEYYFDSSVQSSYGWRGVKLNDSPVFQPALGMSSGNLSFEIWGNMELSDDNGDQFDFNEVDYTIAYDVDFEKFGFSAGYIYYSFPDSSDDNTSEIFAGLYLNCFLSPTFMIYRDIGEIKGTYYQFSIAHTFNVLDPGLSDGMELFVAAGYGDLDYKTGYFHGCNQCPDGHGHGGNSSQTSTIESGPVDFSIGLDLPVNLKHGTLSFNAIYSTLSDSDIHSPDYEEDDSQFIYGITYSISF